jgi:hypothetical protein
VIYVLDVSALLGIQVYVPTPELVFDTMVDLVDEGTVCFCDEVLEELERVAKGTWTFVWAKSVARSRTQRGGGYENKVLAVLC